MPRCFFLGLTFVAVAGCDWRYPEVVLVNETAAQVQLRNLSFNGCVWEKVLAYGEATSPGQCLPGEDRIHFERLAAAAYCQKQSERGTIEGVCPCDGGVPDGGNTAVGESEVPLWFNYQTATVHRVGYGEFRIFEIRLDDMEQDFSVPGPYGH